MTDPTDDRPRVRQLTRDDAARMTTADVAAAMERGQFAEALRWRGADRIDYDRVLAEGLPLYRRDLHRMTPAQVIKAHDLGRLAEMSIGAARPEGR